MPYQPVKGGWCHSAVGPDSRGCNQIDGDAPSRFVPRSRASGNPGFQSLALASARRLLPDFIEICGRWDVAYDARGSFIEPHAGSEVAIGTLEVRDYLRRVGQSIARRR